MNSKLYLIADKNTSVSCHNNKYETDSRRWQTTVAREIDGTALKVVKNAPTLEESIDSAVEAFSRLVSPMKELSGAQIEYQPVDLDGVPF